MLGTLPVYRLAPLEYRNALDAAASLVQPAPLLVCAVPELKAELAQRFPLDPTATPQAALWVEPDRATWPADLQKLAQTLARGQTLVILASRPLARLLPERRAWAGQPLGLEWNGLLRLRLGLLRAGFKLEQSYGFHSPQATALNFLSHRAERLSRPALADRFHFAARLRYRTTGPLALFSTVALLQARKERD